MRPNYREIYVAKDVDMYALPPTGYLIGIIISIPYDAEPKDYAWEITDQNLTALYAEDFYYVGMQDTGYVFPEQQPNVDTSKPYILKFTENHPRLIIRMFSQWD
jgi:hypothetical protein